jgi:hypothetical protein
LKDGGFLPNNRLHKTSYFLIRSDYVLRYTSSRDCNFESLTSYLAFGPASFVAFAIAN